MTKQLKRKKCSALLLKIDIQKAFDTLSWEFLIAILVHLGFRTKWVDLIACLLHTTSTRVLINGDLMNDIDHRRGLRQGDPLSSLLFVIAMKTLVAIIDAAASRGILSPLGGLHVPFRASLYADDVVVFLKPSAAELAATIKLLDIFAMANGLQDNWRKSVVSPIACTEDQIAAAIGDTECPVQQFPITYLGMPLFDARLNRVDFQPIVDKMLKSLRGWKAKFFSLPGRVELVKTCLSAMAIYQMMAIAPQVWLCKRLDKLRRGFIWAKEEIATGRKCLVRWPLVCQPKENGGLGMTDLQKHSRALRLRWIWLLWTDHSRPWQGMQLPTDHETEALFRGSTHIIIGDGRFAPFWSS
ncbi:hypothetical protein ACQ4PT_055727 [Festuca glaucescens]